MQKLDPVRKYVFGLLSLFKTNIRDYGMYIALGVIFLVLSLLTGGNFLSPTNFSNLINQTGYIAVLAVGMTLVIVTRQIDLSVGYLGAFMGAYVVVSVENQGVSLGVALLMGLLIAVLVGIAKGFLVARINVPSFVVTLAGMFIFKGLLMIKTGNRTISTSHNFFNEIGTGYLPSQIVTFNEREWHLNTLILGVVLLIGFILVTTNRRRSHSKLGIKTLDPPIFVSKLLVFSSILIFLTLTLALYRGISYLLLITVTVMVIYHIATTQTVLGRRIYAVGGNPEAAQLSGINVNLILIIVFISMGILTMIAGIMYVSYVQNTSPNHGPFWELYAIAAAYIGGTSANGGVGRVINAVIGSLVIVSLRNGMSLAGVDSKLEPIVLGGVLLLAVIFDIYTRNIRPIDLIGMHYARQSYREEYQKAKKEHLEAQQTLKEGKNKTGSDLVALEYRVTTTRNTLRKIEDTIRGAKEEDYLTKITPST